MYDDDDFVSCPSNSALVILGQCKVSVQCQCDFVLFTVTKMTCCVWLFMCKYFFFLFFSVPWEGFALSF